MTEETLPQKEYRFEEMDWDTWVPVETATLCFIIRNGQVLLIHKKRGLGAGKINGPGGRLDPGETPLQAAIREVQEELCVTPLEVKKAGELFFQFTNDHSIHGHVYTATGFEGQPTETDEAIPLWTQLDAIPYDRMWADDRLWIPLMLAGTPFTGRFLFDDDTMLGHEVQSQIPNPKSNP